MPRNVKDEHQNRFEGMTRALLSTPKTQIDRQLAKAKTAKEKKRKAA